MAWPLLPRSRTRRSGLRQGTELQETPYSYPHRVAIPYCLSPNIQGRPATAVNSGPSIPRGGKRHADRSHVSPLNQLFRTPFTGRLDESHVMPLTRARPHIQRNCRRHNSQPRGSILPLIPAPHRIDWHRTDVPVFSFAVTQPTQMPKNSNAIDPQISQICTDSTPAIQVHPRVPRS